MLHQCNDHIDAKNKESKESKETKEKETKEDDTHQAFAVKLGVALIAMGEDVHAEMALWIFNHLVGPPFTF